MMKLSESFFDGSRIEKYSIGGGILIFSSDPQGVTHILLGRERFMANWKGSCRWSGFEGSRKDRETIRSTALREFDEESLGTVCTRATMRNLISSELYEYRIVLRILTERDTQRYHCTYAVRIPWDPDIPKRFHSLRTSIEHVDRIRQEWEHARHQTPMTDDLPVGPVKQVGNAVHVMRNASDAPCIVHAPWVVSADGVRIVAVFHGDDANALLLWSALRDKLERALEKTSHPCLAVERDNTFRLVQRVRLSHDHLEKDQVRWWSIGDLTTVLKNRGVFENEKFRAYFLPVLQTVVSELTDDDTVARDFRPRPVSPQATLHEPLPPTARELPGACPTDA